MDRRVAILGTPALVGAALGAGAAQKSVSTAKPIRIGFVDPLRVAELSAAVRKKLAERKGRFAESIRKQDEKYQADRKRRTELLEKIKRQQTVLDEGEVEKMHAEIERLEDEMAVIQLRVRKSYWRSERDTVAEIVDEILEAVERVAKANGIDFVFQADMLLFASNRVDLTDRVVREIESDPAAPGSKGNRGG